MPIHEKDEAVALARWLPSVVDTADPHAIAHNVALLTLHGTSDEAVAALRRYPDAVWRRLAEKVDEATGVRDSGLLHRLEVRGGRRRLDSRAFLPVGMARQVGVGVPDDLPALGPAQGLAAAEHLGADMLLRSVRSQDDALVELALAELGANGLPNNKMLSHAIALCAHPDVAGSRYFGAAVGWIGFWFAARRTVMPLTDAWLHVPTMDLPQFDEEDACVRVVAIGRPGTESVACWAYKSARSAHRTSPAIALRCELVPAANGLLAVVPVELSKDRLGEA